jgi:N-acetylglucosaminylphosphatidylinositol deacetylase
MRDMGAWCLEYIFEAMFVWLAMTIVAVFVARCLRRRPRVLTRHGPVLLVIAHPDDEAMFFAPSITALRTAGLTPRCAVLCLTADPPARADELRASCTCVFGIPADRVRVAAPPFPDSGPSAPLWDPERVADAVERAAEEFDLSVVLTFDRFGVSGHAGHRSVAEGLRCCLARTSPLSRIDRVLFLDSQPLVLKYLAPLTIALHGWRWRRSSDDRAMTKDVIVTQEFTAALRAMAEHHSQFVSYRKLWLITSCFPFINVLTEKVKS